MHLSAIDEMRTRLKHLSTADWLVVLMFLAGVAIAFYTYFLRHP